MLLRMQSYMIIEFKKVFRCGYHDNLHCLGPNGGQARGSSWRSGFGYHKSSNIYAYTTVKSQDICMHSIV